MPQLTLPIHELETTSKSYHRESLKPQTIKNIKELADTADWSHTLLNIPKVWSDFKVSGKNVNVCVLDTGVDYSHLDLNVKIGKDFTGSRYSWGDVVGHGTHCSGIIAALNNGYGTVGIAPDSTMMMGKVLGDDGSGSTYDIAQGIDWAVGMKADIISMSLGGDGPIDLNLRSAIDRALKAGVIVVAAAGNSGPYPDTVGNPGNYTSCVTVGACDKNSVVASFSSRGPQLDVVAPGVDILSTVPGSKYATMSGTSMACPCVAGFASLFVEYCRLRKYSYNQGVFEGVLKQTAKDLGTPGFDNNYGSGLIQPYAALSWILEQTKGPSPPVPDPDEGGNDGNDGGDGPVPGLYRARITYSDGSVEETEKVVSKIEFLVGK